MIACKAVYGSVVPASHLQVIMTAQEYIQSKLKDLGKSSGLVNPDTDGDGQLVEAIFRLVMSKKFRKYSISIELADRIKNAIRLNVKERKPINFTFLHGCYKLWRLRESPEADWAELFALMYYTKWVKPICEIYEPGVWFDFFVDDLIIPEIDNITMGETWTYRKSCQSLLIFLKPCQPSNLKMTITGVGEQFESPEAFRQKLEKDVVRYTELLQGELPNLDDKRKAMIELNVKATPQQQKDPMWREKNALVHDAYMLMTVPETGYHFAPSKIRVFVKTWPPGAVIAVGTTKDSIAKFWVGAGALKPQDDSYRQIVLSPKQLAESEFEWHNVSIKGLEGKNFKKVRIIKKNAAAHTTAKQG